MKNLLLSFTLLGLSLTGFAQTRYVDDVFSRSDVVMTPNVPFGQNFYFLSFPQPRRAAAHLTPCWAICTWICILLQPLTLPLTARW